MNKFYSLITLFLISSAFGQNEMHPRTYNYEAFSYDKPEITAELEDLTPVEYRSHPEYGILPFNAPCDNCYELLQYRKDSSRMFVEKGSEGTQFYSQKGKAPLHYQDSEGNWLYYDYRLKPTSEPGIYQAEKQDTPIEINTNSGETIIYLKDGSEFKFNRISLYHKSVDGVVTLIGAANWSDYSAGDDGIKVYNAWPGIDMEIQLSLDRVKTNYIINSNPGFADGVLIFSDDLEIPQYYSLHTNPDAEIEGLTGMPITEIELSNENGVQVLIDEAFGYDHSGIKENYHIFGYGIEAGKMDLHIPVSWINNPDMVYPLVIDPSVNSSATYTSGVMRYRYNGSYCGGANPDCQYNLVVARPANSTLTGATFDLFHQTSGGCGFSSCWMSEAGFYFQTSCGVDGYWGCAWNGPGTCSASGLDISGLVSCLAPACSGNVTFSIFNSYCWCSTGGNCGNSCHWIDNNSWVVTITGSTLETLGNTATGNGSTTITPPNCKGNTTLDPTAANGVPGYTYSWSTGSTSSTINVPNSPPTTYTCTVTDACGVSRIATFNIDACISMLAIELNEFKGEQVEDGILIQWETLSETDNSHFLLERKQPDGSFEIIGKIDGQVNSSQPTDYRFFDANPQTGLNYYRLTDVNTDGETEHTDVIVVQFNLKINQLGIIPNPNEGVFDLRYDFPYSGEYVLEIYSSQGRLVHTLELIAEKGEHQYQVDLSKLDKGIYSISLISKGKIVTERLLIK